MKSAHLLPERREGKTNVTRQQCLPLAVLKRFNGVRSRLKTLSVATTPTVYGIETLPVQELYILAILELQQYLPFTVCAVECETAEEQSDDEVCTSQVSERREDKTKVIKQQYLPLAVLKHG